MKICKAKNVAVRQLFLSTEPLKLCLMLTGSNYSATVHHNLSYRLLMQRIHQHSIDELQ
jgi:hypothetical protein